MKLFCSALLIFFIIPFAAQSQMTVDAGPDQGTCHNDTLKISPVITGSYTSINYEWKNLNTGTVISTARNLTLKQSNPVASEIDTVLYMYTVSGVSNGNPFTETDTVLTEIYPLPAITFPGFPPRCFDDGNIKLTGTAWASWVDSASDPNVNFTSKSGWVTGGPYPVTQFYSYTTHSPLPIQFNDSICAEYTGPHQCYNKVCKKIIINPNPDVEARNGIFCQKAGLAYLDVLRKKPFNTLGGIQTWECISVPPGSGLDPANIVFNTGAPNSAYFVFDPGTETETNRIGAYLVKYCFQNPSTACKRCDTVTVNITTLPIVSFLVIPKQCINSSNLNLNDYVNLTNGKWSVVAFGGSRDKSIPSVANALNKGVKQDSIFVPATGTGVYTLKIIHTKSGCLVSDSIDITVNGLPVVSISAPDTICSNDTASLVSNYGNNGLWTGAGIEGDKFIPARLTLNSKYSPYKSIYAYTNPLTGCTNKDSLYILVQAQPEGFINGADTQIYYLNTGKQITATLKYTSNMGWWTDGSGTLSTYTNPSTLYTYDPADTLLPSVKMAIIAFSGGACPDVVTDTLVLLYQNSPLNSIHSVSSKDMLVYPVPAQHTLNIEFRSFIPDKIVLINSQGQAVYSTNAISDNMSLPVSELAKGLYFLLVQRGAEHYIQAVTLD